MDADKFKAFFEEQLDSKLAKNREAIKADNKSTLEALAGRIDSTQDDLQKHKLDMQKELKEVKQSIAELKGTPGQNTYARAAAGGQAAGAGRLPAGGDHRSYWFSRRSARISPVEGDGETEIWAGMQIFFWDKMRIPNSELKEDDIVSARRIRVGRGKQCRLEVLVTFVDVSTRDRVATYAKNLSHFIDNGKSTASFRLDVPANLAGVHRTLLHYGHTMRKSCLLYTSDAADE